MAERKPVVLVDGQLKEMPSTDFLPAASIPEVTAAHIHAATSKATPVDADELGLSDSAASWGLKKLTFANLAAWVRNITLTGLSTATNAVITAADTVLSALGKLQKQVSDNLTTLTSHTGNTSNPHGVTKAQVGLGSVDNTSDASKPISTATQTALDATVKRLDVGTSPAQVPSGQHLGKLAYMDELAALRATLTQPQAIGAVWVERVSDTSIKLFMRGSDGVARSTTLTLS